MSIEAELKNSKPMQPHQRAMLNILFTASQLDCLIHRQLRPFGLTHPQYNILRILNGSYPKGLSVLDIKSRMIDRNSNVGRLVEKLHEHGWAERMQYSEDRRMLIVTISEKGKELLSEIEAQWETMFDPKPGHTLCETEAAQLSELLDKFRV